MMGASFVRVRNSVFDFGYDVIVINPIPGKPVIRLRRCWVLKVNPV